MSVIHHPNVVSDGLVACWDAGNRVSYPGAGTSWAALGAGSAGTLVNTPSFVDGKMGFILFDGTNDYCQFGVNTMTFSDPGTIILWIRWLTSAATGGIFTARQSGGDQGSDGGYQYPAWSCYNNSNDDLRWISGRGSYGFYDTGLVDGEWAQLAITFRNPGGSYAWVYTTVYVNGVEKSLISGTVTSPYFTNTDGAFRIANGNANYWNGGLASAHVYNRELTAAEVAQNYNATKGRFT